MKKILFRMVCLLLLICFSIPATACSKEVKKEFEFEVVGNYVKVIRFLGDVGDDGKLVIPNTYNDLPVKEISGNILWENREIVAKIQKIDFPDYLEEIEDMAFSETEITSLVFPDSLKTIGSEAFAGCNSLKQVYFGRDIENIGHRAFAHCNNLTYVGFDEVSTWEVSLGSTKKRIYSLSSGANAAQYLRDGDFYASYSWKKIS